MRSDGGVGGGGSCAGYRARAEKQKYLICLRELFHGYFVTSALLLRNSCRISIFPRTFCRKGSEHLFEISRTDQSSNNMNSLTNDPDIRAESEGLGI